MDYNGLYRHIMEKGSYLCVGLDTDTEKIPAHLRSGKEPVFEFNKAIIDATAPYAVAYKPNIAFYEAEGTHGLEQLEKTVAYLGAEYPEMLVIADAKRGDIGNTADRYAKAFFEVMDFGAVTLSPYMGSDAIRPFLRYEGRWSIVLALTSNPSAEEFETLSVCGEPLYQTVIKKTIRFAENEYGSSKDRLMFVVGATRAEEIASVRSCCPEHFLLVPGVGAQGGSLAEVARYGMNSKCGLIVNSSRGIIYASSEKDFAEAAAVKAKEMAAEMRKTLCGIGKI